MRPDYLYEVIKLSLEDILKALPELKPFIEKTAYFYNITSSNPKCSNCGNNVNLKDNYCRVCGAKFFMKRHLYTEESNNENR